MNLEFSTIYDNFSQVFDGNGIDLRACKWIDPWCMSLVTLKALEMKDKGNRALLLPTNQDVNLYLKRMHLDKILVSFGYEKHMEPISSLTMNERDNPNVHEIIHCVYRDDFSARLSSRVRIILKSFGLGEEDEQRATALIGELGNNVFDHNDGSWPSDVRGAFIVGQHYPQKRKLEIAVADPGMGFISSLKTRKPEPKNDIDAIRLGLSGVTGRVGEPRGNGLKYIQEQTIDRFRGSVRIHSGEGLVVATKEGYFGANVPKIKGTIASFVVKYT